MLLKTKGIPKSFLKLYRAKDIRNEILSVEPDFYRKLEFMNINLEAIGLPNRVFIPDLQILNRIYGQLGDLLHAQKEPENTVEKSEWWNSIHRTVEEADNYLQTIAGYDFGSFDLSDRGLEIFEKWEEGTISRKEAIQIIRSDLG